MQRMKAPPIYDENGLIEKIANNQTNKEDPNWNSNEEIRKKLDFYRAFFNKVQDLPDDEFVKLKDNFKTFFNIIPAIQSKEAPQYLFRISNNNRICSSLGIDLTYLEKIENIMAPPKEFSNFGRCNLPGEQVLYTSLDEVSTYWECKPKNGDVITISRLKLKERANFTFLIVRREKNEDKKVDTPLQEMYGLLEDFLVEIFTLEVERNRPRDYLFSAIISSTLLHHHKSSFRSIKAILYASVQRQKFSDNFALVNEDVLKYYDLEAVENRFILDEFEDLNPTVNEYTTDSLIGTFGTNAFNIKKGLIIYNDDKSKMLFKLFRELQTGSGKQTRTTDTNLPKNLSFNLAPSGYKTLQKPYSQKVNTNKLGRNDKVNVEYQNGTKIFEVKYKRVKDDIDSGRCQLI